MTIGIDHLRNEVKAAAAFYAADFAVLLAITVFAIFECMNIVPVKDKEVEEPVREDNREAVRN